MLSVNKSVIDSTRSKFPITHRAEISISCFPEGFFSQFSLLFFILSASVSIVENDSHITHDAAHRSLISLFYVHSIKFQQVLSRMIFG